MGLFHCPMGAAYYDDDPCIDCRLCLAKTKEEMIEASERIRNYLRSHAEVIKGPSKKIAVCGKGGTGKSTITALLANAMRQLGHLVLVMDMDESNPGLHRMFGFSSPPKPLMSLSDRFASDKTKLDTGWLQENEISIKSIPNEYVLEENNLKFIIAGKISDPFQGCACSIGGMARDFIQKLVLKNNEIVLIDMEAGIESFGRGIERGVDTVLITVEPSFESLALAEKISYMADGIGINKVRAIPNKIPSVQIGKVIAKKLESKNIKVIGTVYIDDQINKASLEGKGLPSNSDAAEEIKKITQLLLAPL